MSISDNRSSSGLVRSVGASSAAVCVEAVEVYKLYNASKASHPNVPLTVHLRSGTLSLPITI